MYTRINYKTKKALREAVAAWNDYVAHGCGDNEPPHFVAYFQPGPFGGNEPRNGTFCCEGPHYPEPHRWYATCEARDGVIVKVK
jgi:hypothetical protein